ncbi:Trm112 family protein [Phytoactinopolyspora limicola]|uniref:Trm112 family protein n=1 Tax=Phytoactinopolyspora limicola TaxID=2715536 RepID=UPI001409196C|nr:Trm112 family protein [Phytoactinopolyspora limicola]
MKLDPLLADVIVCPACHGRLDVGPADDGAPATSVELACTGCARVYPVRDGVPVLLVDEARTPTDP